MTTNTEPLKVGVIAFEIKPGVFTLIDQQDLHLVEGHKWFFESKRVYRREYKDGKSKSFSLHRVIMNPPPDMVVDHIDGNPLNNTRENLRICTMTENNYNRFPNKNSTSQFKGVHWEPIRGKWIASIRLNKKQKAIGTYADEHEAAHAYNKQAIIHHGEFAKLNPVGAK